jgi:hypothetical protein
MHAACADALMQMVKPMAERTKRFLSMMISQNHSQSRWASDRLPYTERKDSR